MGPLQISAHPAAPTRDHHLPVLPTICCSCVALTTLCCTRPGLQEAVTITLLGSAPYSDSWTSSCRCSVLYLVGVKVTVTAMWP